MSFDTTQIVPLVRRTGALTARQVLGHLPELQDTATATDALRRLVEEGKLVPEHTPGRNVTYDVPLAHARRGSTPVPAPKVPLATSPAPRRRESTQTARRLERIERIERILLASPAPLLNHEILERFPAKLRPPRQGLLALLKRLAREGRVVCTGASRGTRYHASPAPRAPAKAPTASRGAKPMPQTLELASGLVELLLAERRLYAALIRAGAASTDTTVRRLATAAHHQQLASNALMA